MSLFNVSDETANNPNFRGSSEDKNVPDLPGIPQSAGLIGANITFRNFTFTNCLMSRKDHASLGASPDKISFSDRSTVFGEVSNLFGASYEVHLPNLISLKLNASFLYYEMDENSSYIGIEHPLSNGQNFMYSKSTSANIEPTISYKRSNFNILLGAQIRPSNTTGFQNFMQSPYNESFYEKDAAGNYIIENSQDTTSSISPYSTGKVQTTISTLIFTQALFKTEKINALAGLSYQQWNGFSNVFNMDFGIIYRFAEKILGRRVFYFFDTNS